MLTRITLRGGVNASHMTPSNRTRGFNPRARPDHARRSPEHD